MNLRDAVLVGSVAMLAANGFAQQRPNILFIFSDDHRHDLLGVVNPEIETPNLDRLATSGVRFTRAYATTAICSPSRAAILSGRYGTRNGVPTLSDALDFPDATFAHDLGASGYRTAHVGKWHLGTTPSQAGFDHYARINSNGSWFQRSVDTNMGGAPYGVPSSLGGTFYETFMADVVIDYVADHVANHSRDPFVVWWCNQVPHVDGSLRYPDVKTDPTDRTQNTPWGSPGGHRADYNVSNMPVPANWADVPSSWGPPGTKPGYLATSRFVTKSVTENYGGPGGYTNPAPGTRNATVGEDNVQQHNLEYYASVTALDQEIGRVLDRLEDPNGDGNTEDSIADNTWVVFMGDNGWQTGHHRFTSKVLAYEEACRVPLIVRAPGVAARSENNLTLNIDLTSMFYDLAGLQLPTYLQGTNLRTLIETPSATWRSQFYYEAVVPERSLGAEPHDALSDARYKLIRTYSSRANALANTGVVYEELYDLETDPDEMINLANNPAQAMRLASMRARLATEKAAIANSPDPGPRVRYDNTDFDGTPFDREWSNPGLASVWRPGLLGTPQSAFVGVGTGRLSRPLPGLTDFALGFLVQPITVQGGRSWNLVLHTAGGSGASSAGASLNLRGDAQNAFQVFDGRNWVDVPGGANSFAVNQATTIVLEARNFDGSGAATYDLHWSTPGSSTVSRHATDLSLFQRTPTSAGITGLNFARTSSSNGTFVVDELCISTVPPTPGTCNHNFLFGGTPHGDTEVGGKLEVCRVLPSAPGALLGSALLIGLTGQVARLPLGSLACPGMCRVLDAPTTLLVPATNPTGQFAWNIPVPSNPNLRGFSLLLQSLAFRTSPNLCVAVAPLYRITIR